MNIKVSYPLWSHNYFILARFRSPFFSSRHINRGGKSKTSRKCLGTIRKRIFRFNSKLGLKTRFPVCKNLGPELCQTLYKCCNRHMCAYVSLCLYSQAVKYKYTFDYRCTDYLFWKRWYQYMCIYANNSDSNYSLQMIIYVKFSTVFGKNQVIGCGEVERNIKTENKGTVERP